MTLLQESILRISFLIVWCGAICPIIATVWSWFLMKIGFDESEEEEWTNRN